MIPALVTLPPVPLLEETASACLLEVIELKWLLAGQGVRVHVERLLRDREYARQTLALAAGSPSAALRKTARHVAGALGLGEG